MLANDNYLSPKKQNDIEYQNYQTVFARNELRENNPQSVKMQIVKNFFHKKNQ